MKFGIKLIAIILTIIILSLSLTACSTEKRNDFLNEITLGLWDAILLDEKEHNLVEYIDADTVKYQGNTYYLAPLLFIHENTKSNLEERGYEYIGWSGFRFFYIDVFYGDSRNAPYILYETRLRSTYFREDYDYKTDTFKIEGFDDIICFGKDLIETSPDDSYPWSMQQYIVLRSTTHACLDIQFGIFSYNEKWYARSNDFVYFELSENFVEILVKNQIIT